MQIFHCIVYRISIHSLRMEGDVAVFVYVVILKLFQSTPSVWRETIMPMWMKMVKWIFQSTPSVWRETELYSNFLQDFSFQSTPSVWRETLLLVHFQLTQQISIHSLRMEGDLCYQFALVSFAISIHSLRMEGDGILWGTLAIIKHFNPLPPYGGRQQNCTGKRFSFRLSLYNPAKKDAKDYILHPKK